MTKKDMLRCYKELSTCDMEKVEHVVNAIHKAFDTDDDGTVGKKKKTKKYSMVIVLSVRIDFKEFVIGFLLTTKGSMEEKLDYTFQLYGWYMID